MSSLSMTEALAPYEEPNWELETGRIVAAFGVRRVRIKPRRTLWSGQLITGRIFIDKRRYYFALQDYRGSGQFEIVLKNFAQDWCMMAKMYVQPSKLGIWSGGNRERRLYLAKAAYLLGYSLEQLEQDLNVNFSGTEQIEIRLSYCNQYDDRRELWPVKWREEYESKFPKEASTP